MDHDSELISHILEILDRAIHISVLSWKYWIVRSIFQSYPGNSGSYDPYISPILEIVDRTIHISVPILEILDRTIHISVLWGVEYGNNVELARLWIFFFFCYVY